MPYAILQRELAIPPLDKLKRAFPSIKGLTALDAYTLGHDAYGVLVKDLSIEDATTLQNALRVEGIETEVVDERRLPAMPATKFVRRLDCSPQALLIYDPLGRNFPVEWRHVMIVAAGSVRRSHFRRVQKPSAVAPSNTDLMAPDDVEIETTTREEKIYHLMLEILLTRAVARYSVTADEFSFAYLGPRMTRSLPDNFCLLIQDLATFARHATLNRGASCLVEPHQGIFAYPSKNAFFEEITWLLWKANQPGAVKSSS